MPRKLRTHPRAYEATGDAREIVYHYRLRGNEIPEPVDVTTGSPVYARADHGRWIVDCDVDQNAQYVDDGDLRFFCITCFNVGNAAQWREIIWPTDADEIESALMVRAVANRNWIPGETVANLEAENVAHGLPENDEAI